MQTGRMGAHRPSDKCPGDGRTWAQSIAWALIHEGGVLVEARLLPKVRAIESDLRRRKKLKGPVEIKVMGSAGSQASLKERTTPFAARKG